MEEPARQAWFVERRLTERRLVHPIPVAWRADARRRGLRRDRPDEGHIVNLSPTGAGVIAPHRPELAEGHRVQLRWDDLVVTVEVRRVEGGPVPGLSYYGVRFRERDAGFDELVDATIAAHRPRSVEAMRAHGDPTPPPAPRP